MVNSMRYERERRCHLGNKGGFARNLEGLAIEIYRPEDTFGIGRQFCVVDFGSVEVELSDEAKLGRSSIQRCSTKCDGSRS
jgi:hypothetical protein